jgi:uncharacterized protein with GYD domain
VITKSRNVDYCRPISSLLTLFVAPIPMPKFLIEANYVGEGFSGLLKEGGSKRRAAIDDLFKSVGGSVEAFYFAFGDKDVFIIGELPDNAAAAALALRVNASGAAMCTTTVLITPHEIDDAVRRTAAAAYRPPGYAIDEYEMSTWDSEGGHLRQESAGKGSGQGS